MQKLIVIALLICISTPSAYSQRDTAKAQNIAQIIANAAREDARIYESLDSNGKEEVKKFSKGMYEENLRNTQLHNCNIQLIALDRKNIGNKNPDWDAVIAKAGECLAIKPNAVAYDTRAKAYMGKGNLLQALANYTLAVKHAKEDVDATKKTNEDLGGKFLEKEVQHSIEYEAMVYERRADVYILLSDKKNAEKDLRTAVDLAPGSYSAKDKLDNLDNKIAEKVKEQRIAHPKTADDYVLAGQDKWMTGKYNNAVEVYTQAISLDAKNTDAYIGRGKAYRQLNQPEQAMADYNKAITIAPQNAEAYTERGYLDRDKSDWNAAISDFNTAIRLKPGNSGLLSARASAYTANKQYEAAMKDYAAALATAKDAASGLYDSLTAWSGAGDVYRLAGKPSEAAAAYAQAIAKGANDYFAKIELLPTYVECGKLYAAANQAQTAAAYFNEALKTSPDYKDAKTELARLQAAVSAGAPPKTAEEWAIRSRQQFDVLDYDNAIASLTQSIGLDTRNAVYYALRGAAYIAKDNAAYKSDFERAISLDPKNTMIYFIRGSMLYSKGKKAEAATDFRKVLEIDPNNQQAKEVLKQTMSN